MKRRGIIASDVQRKPAARLSAESIAEVEWLFDRLLSRLNDNKDAFSPMAEASFRP
jgi:hypothetical protein